MKKWFACVCVLAAFSSFSGGVEPLSYYGEIGRRLAVMMTRHHVLQRPMDDEISARAWTNLVTFYDFDHSIFLQSDLDRLAAREKLLDDEIKSGQIGFGFDVYRLYCDRLKERIVFATNLLAAARFDFSSNETCRIKRKDAPWPATVEEANEYWRRRLKNEMLALVLTRELDREDAAARKARKVAASGAQTGLPDEDCGEDEENEASSCADDETPPEEILVKKYRQYYNVLTEPDEEAVLQHYLSAITRAYDPHSDYLSPASKEDFDMDMSLTLCGVGAVLQMEDGALKIAEIIPGGPLDNDGRIEEGDKIVGVKQGDGEMEDVTWQPMKKSIRKIRGPKGTHVTLEIIPRSDPSGAQRKLIEIVRDEIKLEDQAATGRVETVSLGGFTNRLGYVYLPGFYGSMDKRPDQEGYRSSAADVAQFVADFNSRDVEGMVLDLRGDGGGSLREAVMLSALFVPNGPVVQIRDTRQVASLPIPPGNPVAFKKPLVVLVDRASASASEIVAGHLRDTGRAIVLGDSTTHGKGTVQTVMGMGPEKFGSMKITTARFYRVDGRSTQLKGIAADIHLPSLLDSLDIGEDKLTYALPFTRIRGARYRKCWNLDIHLGALAEASAARLAKDERYLRHLENVAGMKAIGEREEVPLEYSARKAMMRADRDLSELDSEESEQSDAKKGRRHRNRRDNNDIVLDEAFRILADLVRLNGGEELPPMRLSWLEALEAF